MPPKSEQKDNKADSKSKEGKKEEPKNLENNNGNSDQSCTAFAKALIYIVPIALYIPWAYRMFKGQPCCPEVPKPPPTAGSTCSTHGKPKWPKYPGKGKGCGSQKGEGSCGAGEATEYKGMPKECQEQKGPAEQDDCGKKSRQCLDKCLDKCLSRDGGRGKGGKRKEKKRSDEYDDEDNPC